ncbi:MAG: GH13_20 / GH13 / GH13_36 / GH13_1 / GH13_ 21 / GH13_2 / GH13_16 / GH13_31 / GH13_40 / GH13 _23 / GH13_29 / GH13_17 / GH13_19 / GH13_26 / GH13_37, partial [uncultured Thermomicrobiales bacterium]
DPDDRRRRLPPLPARLLRRPRAQRLRIATGAPAHGPPRLAGRARAPRRERALSRAGLRVHRPRLRHRRLLLRRPPPGRRRHPRRRRRRPPPARDAPDPRRGLPPRRPGLLGVRRRAGAAGAVRLPRLVLSRLRPVEPLRRPVRLRGLGRPLRPRQAQPRQPGGAGPPLRRRRPLDRPLRDRRAPARRRRPPRRPLSAGPRPPRPGAPPRILADGGGRPRRLPALGEPRDARRHHQLRVLQGPLLQPQRPQLLRDRLLARPPVRPERDLPRPGALHVRRQPRRRPGRQQAARPGPPLPALRAAVHHAGHPLDLLRQRVGAGGPAGAEQRRAAPAGARPRRAPPDRAAPRPPPRDRAAGQDPARAARAPARRLPPAPRRPGVPGLLADVRRGADRDCRQRRRRPGRPHHHAPGRGRRPARGHPERRDDVPGARRDGGGGSGPAALGEDPPPGGRRRGGGV